MLRVCGNSTYIHTKPLYMGVAQPRSCCLIIYKIPEDKVQSADFDTALAIQIQDLVLTISIYTLRIHTHQKSTRAECGGQRVITYDLAPNGLDFPNQRISCVAKRYFLHLDGNCYLDSGLE